MAQRMTSAPPTPISPCSAGSIFTKRMRSTRIPSTVLEREEARTIIANALVTEPDSSLQVAFNGMEKELSGHIVDTDSEPTSDLDLDIGEYGAEMERRLAKGLRLVTGNGSPTFLNLKQQATTTPPSPGSPALQATSTSSSVASNTSPSLTVDSTLASPGSSPTSVYSLFTGSEASGPGQAGVLRRPFFSIIADGVHVHPAAVAMAYRSHPGGCVLVSDGECRCQPYKVPTLVTMFSNAYDGSEPI